MEHSVFLLTRFLKHNRRLILTLERPQVQEVVSEWMIEAAKAYKAADLRQDDVEYLVGEFWPKAIYAVGSNPVAEAIERAQTIPLYPEAPKGYGECHATIYRIVYWLNVNAIRAGDKLFFAGSHSLAKQIGISRVIIYRAMKRMEKDGILTVHHAGNSLKATRYNCFLVPN